MVPEGKLWARCPGSSRIRDVIVTATLLALLAVVTRASISNEIMDSDKDHQSYVAFVIDAAETVGVSIGLTLLLFSGRPREGAGS